MKVLAQVVTSAEAISDLEAGVGLRDAATSAVAPAQMLMTALRQASGRMLIAEREATRVDAAPVQAFDEIAQVRQHAQRVEESLAVLDPST